MRDRANSSIFEILQMKEKLFQTDPTSSLQPKPPIKQRFTKQILKSSGRDRTLSFVPKKRGNTMVDFYNSLSTKADSANHHHVASENVGHELYISSEEFAHLEAVNSVLCKIPALNQPDFFRVESETDLHEVHHLHRVHHRSKSPTTNNNNNNNNKNKNNETSSVSSSSVDSEESDNRKKNSILLLEHELGKLNQALSSPSSNKNNLTVEEILDLKKDHHSLGGDSPAMQQLMDLMRKVSERALMKTSKLAMNPAKWLQT